MRPADTAPEAHEVQLEIYRRMGPERRFELGVRMSEDIRALAAEGIRARHPEYSEAEVRFALFRMLLGDELFGRAWPDAPRLKP